MRKKQLSLAFLLLLFFHLGFAQEQLPEEDKREQEVSLNVQDTNESGPGDSVLNTEKQEVVILAANDIGAFINRFWMLIAALLVFFMQAGFKVFEVGLVRKIDGNSVGFKNLADWLIVTLVFGGIGFALMFGESVTWVFGNSFWTLSEFGGEDNTSGKGYEFFLFQLAFAATAVTIVSGALAVRIKLVSYMLLAVLVSAFIYPVFGHWVWGGAFSAGGKAWLTEIFKFHDFAGSTVVHSLGAWVAITGMWFIRPRVGKRKGKKKGNKFEVDIFVPNEEHTKFDPHNLGYSVLGVLILWLGWWGFNGGSADLLDFEGKTAASIFNSKVPLIILNTNIAGSVGGLTAFCYALWFQKKKRLFEKTLGGVLGGLVAITACCDVLGPNQSILVGILAGILHNISYDRLNEYTLFGKIIDDPVGAIPVHGVCGILGTLCVALGTGDQLHDSFIAQLGAQIVGILVCAAYTIVVSMGFFYILRRVVGLEIQPHQESLGETI